MFYMTGLCHQWHPEASHRKSIDAHASPHQCECAQKLTAGRRLTHESLSDTITVYGGAMA